MTDAPSPTDLPDDLPVPEDDGAADHLPGLTIPRLGLPATDGSTVDLAAESAEHTVVVFAYPRTGRPGEAPLVPDWDDIPGRAAAHRRPAGSATLPPSSPPAVSASTGCRPRTPTTNERRRSGWPSPTCC